MKYDIDSINKRKNNMEKIKKLIGIIAIIIIYNVILTFISSICTNNEVGILGYKAYIITSKSMEPTINCNDVVIIKKIKEEDLHTGDIITFNQNQENITHRIIRIEESSNEEKAYITKGDNNNTEDIEKTLYSQIEGKYILAIPGLGKIILTLDNKLIILIIILIVLILCFLRITKQEKIENRREKKKIEEAKKRKK